MKEAIENQQIADIVTMFAMFPQSFLNLYVTALNSYYNFSIAESIFW